MARKRTSKGLLREDHATTATCTDSQARVESESDTGFIFELRLGADRVIKFGQTYVYLPAAQRDINRVLNKSMRKMQSERLGAIVGVSYDGTIVSFYSVLPPRRDTSGQASLPIEDELPEIVGVAANKLGAEVRGMAAELAAAGPASLGPDSDDNHDNGSCLADIIRAISKSGMTIVHDDSSGCLVDCPTPSLDQIPTLPIIEKEKQIKLAGTVTGMLSEHCYVIDGRRALFEYRGTLKNSQFVEIEGPARMKVTRIPSIEGEYTVKPVQQKSLDFERSARRLPADIVNEARRGQDKPVKQLADQDIEPNDPAQTIETRR